MIKYLDPYPSLNFLIFLIIVNDFLLLIYLIRYVINFLIYILIFYIKKHIELFFFLKNVQLGGAQVKYSYLITDS